MTNDERGQLKQSLERAIARPGEGIDLSTPFHWVSEDVEQPNAFFEQLPALLPANSVLYFEGTSIASDVAAFYDQNRSANTVPVARDTIWPVPDIYHVVFSPQVCAGLGELSARHAIPELFDHIKGYRDSSLLFTFHDAFCGWLRISEDIPEPLVAAFFSALGASFHKEQTKPRDPEPLRRLLDRIGRHDLARFDWQPALKRVWRRWTGR
jgi:hypothetical protein